jgi:hypothetical protein
MIDDLERPSPGNAKPQLGEWLFIGDSLPLPSWGSAFPGVRSRDLTVAPWSEGRVRRAGGEAILPRPNRIHDNKVVAPYEWALLAGSRSSLS